MSSDREPQLCLKSLWKAARLVRRQRLPDELGHLPIDGADMLFEIISRRYERAPMVIAINPVTCAAAHRPERTSVFTDAANGGID